MDDLQRRRSARWPHPAFAALRNIWTLLSEHPLSADRRGEALARFLRWQVSSRLAHGSAIIPFVNDTRLVVRRGMTGATGNLYVGLMEFEDMGFVLHFLRPEDLFADVGANVGVYTVLASGACGAATVAVEPVAVSLRALKDNLAINGLSGRVRLCETAVGDYEGVIRFTSDLDTMNHVAPDRATGAAVIEVPLTTLDTVFQDAAPCLIKIDVEGFELPALQGATGTLEDPHCQGVIIEINGSGARYGVSDDAVDGLLRQHGFSPCAYDPFSRQLRPLERYGKHNTLYLKDLELAAERLRSARPFHVLDLDI